MAGKAGSAAELILIQSRRMAEMLLAATQLLSRDPSAEAATVAQGVAKSVKLLSDAGRSVVATEVAARKALAAEAGPAPPPRAEAAADDSEAMDGDDDELEISMEDVDRAREALERHIVLLMGAGAGQPAAAGLRERGCPRRRAPVEADPPAHASAP